MSVKDSSTLFEGSPNRYSSLLRSGHRRGKDVNVLDSPMDVSVERVRLKEEVEYLRRRDRERKVENKRLLSRIVGEEAKRRVLEKDLEVEIRRADVAERRYELLKAEVAYEGSIRERTNLREKEFEGRAM